MIASSPAARSETQAWNASAHGRHVADMNTTMAKVEVERSRVAVAEGE
jgi:hypothetical protein